MSNKTKIQWADSTWNPWSGCTQVSPGCLHCYAETMDNRHLIEKVSHWGKGAPRLKSVGAVKLALALNRKPWICDHCATAQRGAVTMDEGCDNRDCPSNLNEHIQGSYHRRRIFSLSRGDWLDAEVGVELRAEMLHTIYRCGDCVWILCTKRTENFFRLLRDILDCQSATGSLPYDVGFFNWLSQWVNDGQPPINIILLTSVENQEMADKRIPELLKMPAACRGLSLEPLLGPVDLETEGFLRGLYRTTDGFYRKLNWLIIGGESGNGARPCNVDWIRSLVNQGNAAGVATFVKQLGAKPVCDCSVAVESFSANCCQHFPNAIRDKKGGDMSEWPEDLRVQQWPEGF